MADDDVNATLADDTYDLEVGLGAFVNDLSWTKTLIARLPFSAAPGQLQPRTLTNGYDRCDARPQDEPAHLENARRAEQGSFSVSVRDVRLVGGDRLCERVYLG